MGMAGIHPLRPITARWLTSVWGADRSLGNAFKLAASQIPSMHGWASRRPRQAPAQTATSCLSICIICGSLVREHHCAAMRKRRETPQIAMSDCPEGLYIAPIHLPNAALGSRSCAPAMRRLVSDRVHDVTEVRFEHSPGRGHPAYTADHTAFDVLIRCTTPHGHNAFVERRQEARRRRLTLPPAMTRPRGSSPIPTQLAAPSNSSGASSCSSPRCSSAAIITTAASS